MKKIFLFTLLAGAAFIILPGSSYTADDASEVLKLYMGEVKIISVSTPSRIVVGNPAIADVTQVTKNSITLSPKSPGTTTLVFWDNFGEQPYRLKVFAEDINAVKSRIDNLLGKLNLPEVYSQAAEDEGKVLLLGRVKSSQDRERVFTALGSLKDKTVDLVQVKEEESLLDIDVQILELNKDATNTLGFSWPGSVTLTEVGSPALAAAGTSWGKVFKVSNIGRSIDGTANPFTLKLDALVQEGKARILSRPRITCQSGKEAELIVGGEQPIFTTQIAATTGSQGTSVEYKEYGIKLKIKPTLTAEKRIKLSLNVEVSDIGTVQTIGTSSSSETTTTAQAYPLSKRSAATELYLDDGQTIAIGGLIKKKAEEDIRKTPFLSKIPIIGAIFRQKVTKEGGGTGSRGDTELFIVLTPKIAYMEKEKPLPSRKEETSKEEKTSREEQSVESVTQYARIIQERLLSNFSYPQELQEGGYQGTVKLRLHISYTGEPLDIVVIEPSGYQLLDDQAASMAKNITSYPPFPASIEDQELWIDIPVTFQLK
ncbi:MAG: TonB family protein [Candidatus Omnitrophota bacterium]|jgi:pilus assembly protein CpaC|nr:TonB family protein [Candidatus Omnitrophota bacterium]MDD5517824.1 TonB family protein [Candidatus Omnitrophota bacterium]